MEKMDNKNNQKAINKMEHQPILSLILSMSLPPLISMFMQYSYNFIDCMFIARINEEALTAASLSFPMTTLMLAISIGIGVGINILVSRNLGRKNQDEANNVVSHGLIMSSVLGTILVVVLYFLVKPYFSSFRIEDEVFNYGLDYMYICVFLQLPNMVHIAIQKIIQATGNMVAPMLFQIAGVLLNFILDPILIFGWGPFPEMGIKGAAISTVLGYTLSMLLAFYVLLFTKQKVKVKTKNFKMNLEIFKDITILGLPSFIMNALGAFMVSITNKFLITYSSTAVAFFGAYFKAQQMVVMTVNGLIQGCIPIMSYNFGAKNYHRLRKTFKYGTIIAIILLSIGGLLLFVFPREVLKTFMASEEMLVFGVPALRIMTVGYVFNGVSTMIASYMQSISKVKISIFINLCRQLLVLTLAMWIFDSLFGMIGIWYSFIVTEFLTCIIAIYYLKKTENELKLSKY